MPRVLIKGQEIFYAERNTSQPGPAIVMVHGSGGSHRHWLIQLQSLERGRGLALDLPGHGLSAGEPRESISAYADFLIDFLDVLALDKAVVAGHSLGGAIALELALGKEGRVTALVLVDTGARLRVRPEFLNGLVTDFEATAAEFNAWSYGSNVDPHLIRQGERELLANRPEVLRGDLLACNGFDLMEGIGEVTLPTLVICGEEDRLTPLKYSEYLRDNIPGAKLEVVPDAGHRAMLERPVAVSQAIGHFLKNI